MAFKTKFLSVVAMAVLLVFLVLIQQQQQQASGLSHFLRLVFYYTSWFSSDSLCLYLADYGSGHGQLFGEEPSPKILNRKVSSSPFLPFFFFFFLKKKKKSFMVHE